jgi:hypothetical protein
VSNPLFIAWRIAWDSVLEKRTVALRRIPRHAHTPRRNEHYPAPSVLKCLYHTSAIEAETDHSQNAYKKRSLETVYVALETNSSLTEPQGAALTEIDGLVTSVMSRGQLDSLCLYPLFTAVLSVVSGKVIRKGTSDTHRKIATSCMSHSATFIFSIPSLQIRSIRS